MRFSGLKILKEGLTGNKGWTNHWRDPEPKQEYDILIIGGGGHGLSTAYYLAKNPAGTIPCIEEPDTGFTLGEAHAIMTYLARTEGWTDVYPADEQARAKIDAYMHYHHRNVREASVGLVAPKVRKDLDIPAAMQEGAKRSLSNALRTLNEYYLADNQFLFGDRVSIADLAAYVEIGQLRPEFTNVFDMSDYPNVMAWLNAMQMVKGHDAVHVALSELGDISVDAPDMEAIKRANFAAVAALKSAE